MDLSKYRQSKIALINLLEALDKENPQKMASVMRIAKYSYDWLEYSSQVVDELCRKKKLIQELYKSNPNR